MNDPGEKRPIIPDGRITDWRIVARGAIGVEISLWCGFGIGRNLFHVYVRLGVVTLYAASRRLDRFLALWDAARAELRNRTGDR